MLDANTQLDANTRALVKLAIAEDLGSGDLTTDILIDKKLNGEASFVAKETLVVCGHEVTQFVFSSIDSELKYQIIKVEGEYAKPGETLAVVNGSFASILKAERTSLNFLQRLSGIATTTRRVASKLSNPRPRIFDTRKTTPGFRVLEKHAVRVGGGENHRIGLFDAILIKNNHLEALGGGIVASVAECRAEAPSGMRIEVEVRTADELKLALGAKPDVILFDNFSPTELLKLTTHARSVVGDSILFEASGGITEANVRDFDLPTLDMISMGALTHSPRSVDIALRTKLR